MWRGLMHYKTQQPSLDFFVDPVSPEPILYLAKAPSGGETTEDNPEEKTARKTEKERRKREQRATAAREAERAIRPKRQPAS
jgi:hypothetical protein